MSSIEKLCHKKNLPLKQMKIVRTVRNVNICQWYADNVLCKILAMVRTGGFILSSNMLVVLSIDRSVGEGFKKKVNGMFVDLYFPL